MDMLRFKNYRDWRLKQKLLVFSSIFILSSLFLVTTISYMKYTKDFEAQSSSKVQQIIEQVSFNIDSYLDDLDRLSLAPYLNDNIMEALEEKGNGSALEQLQKRRLIEGYLDEMMIYPRQDINRVFMIMDEIYSSGRIQVSVDDTEIYKQFGWYRQAMSMQGTIFVPAHMQQMVNDKGLKVFSIVRQIRSTRNSEQVLGVIKVDANFNGIETICRKVNMGKAGGLFIIDNKQNLIYESTTQLDAVQLFNQIQQSGLSSMKVTSNGQPYLLNTTQLPRSSWSILAINSLTELNAGAAETRNFGFSIAILCAVIASILLFWSLNRFLTPLLTIVRLMKEVERGDLSVRFPGKRGGDEIGYLGSSFNALVTRIAVMLEENTQLVKQVYETELLQKEAQVQALHNQIKPHFMFNTLNMIAMQMKVGKQEKAIDHIYKLSSILRSMTLFDKDITLSREIELLNAYLTIQSSRYDGRLHYSIDIAPALFHMMVPALLFQPIVENAVIHGCESKRDHTMLRITSEEKDALLFFVIEDTGVGMEHETLERLRNHLETSGHSSLDGQPPAKQGTGIGLVNVNKRIKLKYGNDYGLAVDSAPDKGTIVTITLPGTDKKGREQDV